MLVRIGLWITLLAVTGSVCAQQNVVVVLDDSGSMGERLSSDRRTTKIDAAKQALLTVLQQLPADAQVGVVALNAGRDGWILPLGPVDRAQVSSAVQRINANGSTPLGRYIKVGADALLKLRAEQRFGVYNMLIVTDGEASDAELVERYLPDVLARGIVVDVIGVDMRQDHSLATKVQTYRRADDANTLQQAISEIVLGESTAGGSDASTSDFQMLEGLPDEVAVAALQALTTQTNEPIGQPPQPAPRSGPASTSSTPPAPGPQTVDVQMPASDGSLTFFGILRALLGMCCLGLVGVVVLVLIVFRRK